MTLWITGQSSTNTLTATVGVRKTRAVKIPFTVSGMLPNSIFTFWANGTDMTWATRQSGQKMGDTIMSDAAGNVTFDFYAEMNNEISASNNITKYYQFQLKNIVGTVKAFTIMPQTLTVRI